MPKVVLGHTHEVRQLPSLPNGDEFPGGEVYLNSGSAGRFNGLIWGIEIEGGENRIVSWSENEEGRLRRIVWTSDGVGSLNPTESTFH